MSAISQMSRHSTVASSIRSLNSEHFDHEYDLIGGIADREVPHRTSALGWRFVVGLPLICLLGFAVCSISLSYLPVWRSTCVGGNSAHACRVSMSDASTHSQPNQTFSEGEMFSFCNKSILAPGEMFSFSPALPMELPPHWDAFCENLDSPMVSTWHGQNRCWEWMKQVGCYAANWGTLSWYEGQTRAAQLGKAPPPLKALMTPLSMPEICEHHDNGARVLVSSKEAREATRWLNSNINVFVLNLPSDTERWHMLSARMKALGIHFSRIAGIDFTLPNAYMNAKRANLIPMGFNFSMAQAEARTLFQSMQGIAGTMGCAAAHLNAMRHAVAHRREKPLTLILEDDVRLEDDFAVKLRRMLETEAPCDWVAISLKTKCPYGRCISPHLSRVGPDGNEPVERCRHGVNYGFYAMLYRSHDLDKLRTRLAEVVWNAHRPRCLDIDVALASISDEVAYYAVPGMQAPGFLQDGGHASSRVIKNSVISPARMQEEDDQLEREEKAMQAGLPLQSCMVYTCSPYNPSHACQCNMECTLHGNCCADYEEQCVTTTTTTTTRTTTSTSSTVTTSTTSRTTTTTSLSTTTASSSSTTETTTRRLRFGSHDVLGGGTGEEKGSGASGKSKGSCAELGCVNSIAATSCQCHKLCRQYKNCCSDYQERCLGPDALESIMESGWALERAGSCAAYGCLPGHV
eukprot:CAMPEP_0115586736 /NCGR_PEP_ID=MMETSP0272-20121206/7849_1 /TAXON_ID=71861 /ORGANISM="Scrippsiella trochoidea, Strain CCMP3099" /LENGTH=688 /DNA_ID=CAMNT_0003021803 /DNA_START=97 /DNA_END=2160 /DNA_ORIENTATION=-